MLDTYHVPSLHELKLRTAPKKQKSAKLKN